mgnify:CR=1 FL=1
MKILYAFLIILLCLGSSLASTNEMKNIDKSYIDKFCYDTYLFAARIMTYRQNGLPKKNLMSRLNEYYSQGNDLNGLNDHMNNIVNDAYTHPAHLDVEEKKATSERFAYSQRRKCLLAFIDVKD